MFCLSYRSMSPYLGSAEEPCNLLFDDVVPILVTKALRSQLGFWLVSTKTKVLYIPRGHLHEAATSSEPSLHITLTVPGAQQAAKPQSPLLFSSFQSRPTSDFCWGVQMVKHLNTHLRSYAFLYTLFQAFQL